MKNFFFIHIIFVITIIPIVRAQTNSVYRNEVIKKENLELYGGFLFNKLFDISTEWQSNSIDGFRWKAASLRNQLDQSQQWNLMIDGQNIRFNTLNMININQIPLSFSLIDSIENVVQPQIYKGKFSGNGLINLITQKPKQGLAFKASVFTGNEAGDPGPYKYTSYNSENIDVIGPHYSLAVQYGHEFIDVSLNYKANRFLYPIPDKPVGSRAGIYQFEHRKIYSDGVSSVINLNFIPGYHKIIFLYTTSGKYNFLSPYGSDILYFEPASRELPFDTRFGHLGFIGKFLDNRNYSLNYSLTTSINNLMKPYEVNHSYYKIFYRDFSFDWELTSNYDNFNYSVGSSFERTKLTTNIIFNNKSNEHIHFYGSFSGNLNKWLESSLNLYSTYNGINISYKSSMNTNVIIDSNRLLRVLLTYQEYLNSERNDISYWVSNGFYFSDDFKNNISFENNLAKSKRYGLEFGYEEQLNKNLKLTTDILLYSFEHEPVWSSNYSFINNNLSSITTYNKRISGKSFVLKTGLSHKMNSRILHGLNYCYSKPIAGDRLFFEESKIFPNHQLKYSFLFSLGNKLSVLSTLTYTSESLWNEFKNAYIESQGLYNFRLPSKILIDLSLQKYFWAEKLRVNFLFKNILGQDNRQVPYGAIFDFTLMMTADLYLN